MPAPARTLQNTLTTSTGIVSAHLVNHLRRKQTLVPKVTIPFVFMIFSV